MVAITHVDVLDGFLLFFLHCLLVVDVVGHSSVVDVNLGCIPLHEIDATSDVHPFSSVDHHVTAAVDAQAVVCSLR